MQFMNENISLKEKKRNFDEAIDAMIEAFSGMSDVFTQKVISKPDQWLQIQQLCKTAQEIGYTNDKLLQLKVCVLQCLTSGLRDFKTAKNMLIDIEKDLAAGFELDFYYKALLKINKGFVAGTHGNYDDGIAYMNQGIVLLASCTHYNGERLRAITNLIQYYAMRGETNRAEEVIKEELPLFESLSSPIYKSFFIYTHSIVLNDQRKFEESLQILNQTNSYPTLPLTFPHIYLGILQQKIEVSLKLNQLEEAKEYIEKFEEKIKAVYSEKNVAWGNLLLLKSLLLLEDKEASLSLQKTNKALEIYKNYFQGNKKHRNQGRAHCALGKAYVALEDYKKALNAYLLSEDVYETVLKEKKLDDVSDLYKELTILGVKMKDEKCVHKYLNAHINLFGQTHFRTKEILHYLGEQNFLVASKL